MTVSEKVAYLRGLAKGLDIESEPKFGQLFEVVMDILDDIAENLAEIEDNALDLGEEIDVLSEDLEAVESIVYDEEDDDDDDDDCCCDCDDDCCCDEEDYPLFFEVTCPACDNTITIDEDVLNLGTIQCPNCGEMLEFDLDDIKEEEESDED